MTSLIEKLTSEGKLVLLQDYRAGHCASQVYPHLPALAPLDADTIGPEGRFRTGLGFDSVNDPHTSIATFLRTKNSSPWLAPSSGGCCLIASYKLYAADDGTDYSDAAQIFGSANSVAAQSSWALRRDVDNIYFVTCDGVAWSHHDYALPASLNQIETVGVIYTGGDTGVNSAIHVYSPTPSQDAGNITKVPYDAGAIYASAGSLTDTQGCLVEGILRYVAFVRTVLADDVLEALKNEIEAQVYETETCHGTYSTIIADRQLQYATGFGIDASVNDEPAVIGAEVSNSRFFADATVPAAAFRVDTDRMSQDYASVENIHKVLTTVSTDPLLPVHLYNPVAHWKANNTDAAYGTWDFHYKFNGYQVGVPMPCIYLTLNGSGQAYYVTTLMDGTLQLRMSPGGVILQGGPGDQLGTWTHIRVTRDDNGAWRMFVNRDLTLAGWREIGYQTIENSFTDSLYFGLRMPASDAFGLGNAAGEHGFFKWCGAVNPLPLLPV